MLYMTNYSLFNDSVNIFLSTGEILTIYFNDNSGKAYYRHKINTISGIKHPGIYLGTDNLGNNYFAHNHYHFGKPTIS